ncbi:hypothetical protein P3L51_14545 [Streptomyces sp. PSRA5]|uniref:hypothetical protein n=1 Tax=Streptomyces panacea TaxID=3035064 RepID=UPI00339C3542
MVHDDNRPRRSAPAEESAARTDDTTGVGAYLDPVSEYVVSRTLGDPGRQHTTVLRGDVRDQVRELKAGPGGDVVTTGGVTLPRGSSRPDRSTSTGCSCIRWSSGAAGATHARDTPAGCS